MLSIKKLLEELDAETNGSGGEFGAESWERTITVGGFSIELIYRKVVVISSMPEATNGDCPFPNFRHQIHHRYLPFQHLIPPTASLCLASDSSLYLSSPYAASR
ncbi:unnamed protein product [Prunus armeniaca]